MTDTQPLPPSPSCSSPYTYEQGPMRLGPECAYEWTAVVEAADKARIL